jgi:sugar/nucleoside kinase (ribokinase family)
MPVPAIDVVHVGSAARDLTDEDPRGWRLGGGASYSALTTARIGLRTAVVIGVDGQAAGASELDLIRDAGAELLLVPLEEGPVFRNQETPTGRVQGWPTRGHSLPVPDLPESWQRTRAWSLVPVASELGDAWAEVVPPGAFISLAWQGLLREQGPDRLTARRPPAPSRLVEVADLVGVSRHDLAPGARVSALVELLRPGARLAVTDGHDGGRLIRAGWAGRARAERWAAIPPERLVDPTGAGDVFLAALAAAIVRPDLTIRPGRRASMAAHLEFAAAAASFVVEAPGLQGVPTLEAVLSRLARRHRGSASTR